MVVREVVGADTSEDGRSFYFPCSQWLHSGKGDGLIERTLLPQHPPPPPAELEHEQLEVAEEQSDVAEEEQPKTRPSQFNIPI